jgi:RimJ/RimL family protein N-acetyltransferase
MEIRKEYLELLNERLYRLEFHEENQQWHFERYDSKIKQNTYGWFTICDKVTDKESKLLIWYLESFNEKKLSIEFILKKRNQWIKFYNILFENQWNIVPIK